MLTEVHNDNSPLNHSLNEFNNIFPRTFMFGSSYLRLCEHEHRIVRNCFLTPPLCNQKLCYYYCYYCLLYPWHENSVGKKMKEIRPNSTWSSVEHKLD